MTTFLRLTFVNQDVIKTPEATPEYTERLVNADQIATMQATRYFTREDLGDETGGSFHYGSKIVWTDSRRPHSIVTATLDELTLNLRPYVIPAPDVDHDEEGDGATTVCDHCGRQVIPYRDSESPINDSDLLDEWYHVDGEWHCDTSYKTTATVNGSTTAPKENTDG